MLTNIHFDIKKQLLNVEKALTKIVLNALEVLFIVS